MRDRILEIINKIFIKLRPLLLIVLFVMSIFTGSNLEKVYIPPTHEPLVKIVEAGEGTKPKEDQKVFVSITGAVLKPGVYEFKSGQRVNDLIVQAGGFVKNADQAYIHSQINLAQTLEDGEQIYIPSVTEKKFLEAKESTSGQNSGAGTTSEKVNLNTASKDELDTLPGVGISTAEKIIAARPFAKIEDIQNVSGIGEATYAKLKDLITV
jgi:competence protein ComEA